MPWKLCPQHQNEYDAWFNAEYIPMKCECGIDDWKNGELQMTNPPSFPLALVYRCKSCNDVRLEEEKHSKRVRILLRKEKTPQEEPTG